MSRNAAFLVRYLRPHGPKVGALGLCLFASIGLQLFIPQLLRSFIDQAPGKGPLSDLTRLGLTYLGLSVVNQLLSAASTYLAASAGWDATNLLRGDLFRHCLSLDAAFHKDRMPGEMIERIDGDVTSLSNFFSQFLVRVTGAVALMAGVLILMWRESWVVGLALTLFTGITLLILHWRREAAVEPTRQEREASALLFGFIEERLTGIDDIRANGAGRYVMHRFAETQSRWFGITAHAWWVRGTIWMSMTALFAGGYVLALSLGVWLFLSGLTTLGTVYLFFSYMSMLESPLDQITQQLQEFQKAAAGLRRVSELFDTPKRVVSGLLVLAPQAHAVEFENVSFRYVEQDVLKDVSFRLAAGESLGLLGRTGSGKTTLVRLLFRLHDATRGRVLLDGRDLAQTDLEALRRRVGLVTQDVQIFHGTVRDNLTFFDKSVPDSLIWRILADLELRQWIEHLPQGLDTVLESGGGLSAGQAQLLAFGRAFLRNPGLVILDEPSSRLDPATERLLSNAIGRLLEKRTGIIIAHRLSTVERVDKIMVLAGGRIVEFGRREDLARDPASRYSALIRMASGAATLDEEMEGIA